MAEIIKNARTKKDIIDGLSNYFAVDNPRFEPWTFREAINKRKCLAMNSKPFNKSFNRKILSKKGNHAQLKTLYVIDDMVNSLYGGNKEK